MRRTGPAPRTRVALWVADGGGTHASEIAAPSPLVGPWVAWAGDRLLYDARSSLTSRPSIMGLLQGAGPGAVIAPNAANAVATADGTTIVFNRPPGVDGAGIWRTDAEGRRPDQLASGHVWNPVLTSDDRHIVFLSTAGGNQSPWMMTIDGDAAEPIVGRFAGMASLDITRAGNRLLFYSSDAQHRNVFVVCQLPGCTNVAEIPLPENFRYVMMRWTPDGEIAYVDSSGTNIWALPVDGGEPRQITAFTGDREIAAFAWSRDGSRLAIRRAE